MKVIAIILIAAVLVGILGTIGYVGYQTGHYMISQKFSFGDAIHWAWEDYTNWIKGLFGAKAEENPDYFEIEYHVNEHIDVVACTALK